MSIDAQIMAQKRNSKWRPPPTLICFRWIFLSYSRLSTVDLNHHTKFCANIWIGGWLTVTFQNNSRWRWPPSWISFFGHNLVADQHFCTKFGTMMDNQQPKATHSSEIWFSKIQDGGRPPSWILKSYRKSAADWVIGTKFCIFENLISDEWRISYAVDAWYFF